MAEENGTALTTITGEGRDDEDSDAAGVWESLSPAVRGGAAAALVLLMAGILWWSSSVSSTDMAPLFSDLEQQDAADVVASLDEQGIPYQLSGQGGTILVPRDRVYQTRLSLAQEGLPSGGTVGFEVMDNLSMTSTDFDRRVQYLRALQGELTRTVQGMSGVEDARVHVVLPEDTPFLREGTPATAAVFLRVAPNAELSQSSVNGVAHLVASGVEGLDVRDVTVVDGQGRVLSSPDGGGAEAAAGVTGPSNRLQMQQKFEQDVETGLQSLLQRIFGPGNAVARVTASLNFDQRQVESTSYEPAEEDGVVRSIQELQEEYSGTGAAPQGVPGTSGENADSEPPAFQADAAQGESDYTRSETTTNYEIDRIQESLVEAPGAVEELSVAVVVNEELQPEMAANLEDVVSTAVGLQDGRDQINVTGMNFDTSLSDQLQDELGEGAGEEAAETPTRAFGVALPAWWPLAAGALALGLLSVTIYLFVQRRRREMELREKLMIARREAQERRQQKEEEAPVHANSQSGPAVDAAPPVSPSQQTIEHAARQEPERVADLLRLWLAETGEGAN